MSNVFISHRRADASRAEELANEIKNDGHEVWLDDWEVHVGDSIVARILEGLEGATYLVLCCSQLGVMAPWISREWMSALARQLDGANVKILPVLLTGGDVPLILSDIKYADLVTDWHSGLKQLLRAIR
jgi:hypothetical protein